MNLEEYKRRIDKSHSVTGVPSYWEDLEEMTKQRDIWRKIAQNFADATTTTEHDFALAYYKEITNGP